MASPQVLIDAFTPPDPDNGSRAFFTVITTDGVVHRETRGVYFPAATTEPALKLAISAHAQDLEIASSEKAKQAYLDGVPLGKVVNALTFVEETPITDPMAEPAVKVI